jgi:hypothetical protein
MAYVRAGFGSGRYPAFGLFDNERALGIEACFIDLTRNEENESAGAE